MTLAAAPDFRQSLRADEEGCLAQWLNVPKAETDDNFLTLSRELTHPQRTPPVRAAAPVLIPDAAAQFGVISDVEDTVLQTGATSLRSLAGQVLLGNAYSSRQT